ncbi:hypothetical protein [Butyricimonas sp.]|uniref:hypothetical protein n=1 Tax=Butyricimonas sp. TaxID=1969738 RepID=UPI001B0C7DCC|nr:hypothetical protein [Butyricimonas sp.]MBO4957447.1 hypothetical protein [Butyricimonas sp.]
MKQWFWNICLLLYSCQSDKIETYVGEKISYKDSIFLDIQGNLNHPDTMRRHADTWERALARMERHHTILDNQFVWNMKNGAQVKISDNLYDFIIRWWERQNKKLKTGNYGLWYVGGNRYFVVLVRDTTHENY